MKKIFIILTVLILTGFGVYKFFLPPKVSYSEAKIEKKDLEIYLNASGKVRSAQEQKASVPISGEVEFIASTGASFKKGEILARLKTNDLWSTLQQTYASLNKARSNFYYYLEAKGQADRASGWKGDADSKSLVSQANNNVAMAQDGVEAAQFAVDGARANYNKAFIKAAFDGVVGQSLIKVGEIVSPSQIVLNFVTPSSFIFEAEVDEADVRFLKPGQTAKIQIDVLNGQSFEGMVESVDASAHTTTSGGTAYFAKVRFNGSTEFIPSRVEGLTTGPLGTSSLTDLRSGLNGEVQVLKQVKKDSLLVPSVYVSQKDGKSYLLVKKANGLPESRIVELGDFIDGNYQILKGVSLGETILTPIKK